MKAQLTTLYGHLNSLYFPTTKDLTNYEVLTARAYVLMLMLRSLVKTWLKVPMKRKLSLSSYLKEVLK